MHIDIDILVYALIAAVLLGRLWAVLGTRNNNETQRPNPFQPPPEQTALPATPHNAAFKAAPPSRLLQAGPPPESLAGGLAQIEALDKNFNEKQFLANARDVFPKIVTAYAAGSMDQVAALMSPALCAHFQAAADARKAAGQTAETDVLRLKDAEVIAARAEGGQGFLTVKFVSEQKNTLRDAVGTVLGGSVGQGEEATDIWVFGRDTTQPNSAWVVIETRG